MPRVLPGLVRCFSADLRCRGIGNGVRADGGGAGNFGETEVEDFRGAALGDEDVGGFDVAVNDAGVVSGVQGVGDVDADFEEAVRVRAGAAMRCLSVAPSRNSMAMKARPLSSPMSWMVQMFG